MKSIIRWRSTEPIRPDAREPDPMIHLLNRKFRRGILLVTLVGCLGSGCASTNPQKFTAQVQAWVPLGTPAAEAEQIMTRHGFECQRVTKDHAFNQYGEDYLDCDREQFWMHDWNVKLFLEDDKVSRYGPMSIDGRTH
jgi:hypothetical protein